MDTSDSADKLEFEYAPGVMGKYPEFEALLSKLYSFVEEEDLKRITGKISKIMLFFSQDDK